MSLIEHSMRTAMIVAGLDEAGRGCLAGPVVAAATILPCGFYDSVLNDSKKLTSVQRNVLRQKIERHALSYAVAFVYPKRIDDINILRASIEAMHLAIEGLKMAPQYLLIDGNQFYPYRDLSHECVIKGDGKYLSIAAASVLAKTYRDEYMVEQHYNFPAYSWNRNKGYPTKQHREGIKVQGVCHLHRKSFRMLPIEHSELLSNK